jgi:hypothetical protein
MALDALIHAGIHFIQVLVLVSGDRFGSVKYQNAFL